MTVWVCNLYPLIYTNKYNIIDMGTGNCLLALVLLTLYMHYYNTKVPLFSGDTPWLSLSWSNISQCTNEDSLSYLVCCKLTIFPTILNRQLVGYSSILQRYRAVYELEIGTESVRMPSGQNYHFCEVLMGLWQLCNDSKSCQMFSYDR